MFKIPIKQSFLLKLIENELNYPNSANYIRRDYSISCIEKFLDMDLSTLVYENYSYTEGDSLGISSVNIIEEKSMYLIHIYGFINSQVDVTIISKPKIDNSLIWQQ